MANRSGANLSTADMATDWDGGSLASTTQQPFDNVPKQHSVNVYLLICIYVIIFLLAVIGNILVIVTLVQNKRMRTVTNIFLLSLSVSDLLYAILCMPFTLVGNILERFIFGAAVCKIIPYFQGVSVAVSVWTMCAISLERYHAICNPLASRAWQTKTRACKIIVVVWLMAFLVLLPFAIYTQHERIGESEYYKCRENFQSKIFHRLYITCIFMALMFIPLFMMCIAYALIIRELWRGMHYEKRNTKRGLVLKNGESTRKSSTPSLILGSADNIQHQETTPDNLKKEENGTPLNDLSSRKSRGRKTSLDDSSATESFLRKSRGTGASSKKGGGENCTPRSTSSNTAKKRVVKMLLVLVILFFVCWTPTWCMNLWATYDPMAAFSSVTAIQITLIRLLMYASACVNPIVYCFMNKKFRQGFIEAFGCCCCCFVGKKTDTTSLPSQTSVRRHPIQRPHSTNYTNVSSDSSV